MNELKSLHEGVCLIILAMSGAILGSIIGIGNYIIFSIPLIVSASDAAGTMISHLVYGFGLVFVWGIGLGAMLGISKALISRGDEWTEYFSTKNTEIKYGLFIVNKQSDTK